MAKPKKASTNGKPEKALQSSKERIGIVIAIISAIATVLAAIIAILPPILERYQSNEIIATEITTTPIPGFNKYDDPLGIFSIELPSDMRMSTRHVDGTDYYILFIATGEYTFMVDVMARYYEEPLSMSDIDIFNESSIIDTLNNENVGKKTLISNKKTERGYYFVYEEDGMSGLLNVHLLREFDSHAYIGVSLVTNKYSEPVYGEIINEIVSSFSWSPDKILEHLKP